MKTKAEILSECTGIDLPELEFKNEVQVIRPSEALESMDEYAKSVAMEFAEWCGDNGFVLYFSPDGENRIWRDELGYTHYTKNLFAKFEAERNQKRRLTMNESQLTQEISTWEYLAGTLTQEHQQNVRTEIMTKVRNLESILKELKERATP